MSERLESALIALACLFVIFAFAAFLAYLSLPPIPAAQSGDVYSGFVAGIVQAIAAIIAGTLALGGGFFAYAGIRLQITNQAKKDAESRFQYARATAVEAIPSIEMVLDMADESVSICVAALNRGTANRDASEWAVPLPNLCGWPISTASTLGFEICKGRATVTDCCYIMAKRYGNARRVSQDPSATPIERHKTAQEMVGALDRLKAASGALKTALIEATNAQTASDIDLIKLSNA